MRKKTIACIITCFNEEENILEMYKRLTNVFKRLPNYELSVIFVDNDSTDNSENIFTKLAKKDKRVKVIFMSRNFGSPQPSFLAGLSNTDADAAVLLHGDIQDPPELIPKMLDKWHDGYQVVYGIRKKRQGYGILMNFYYKAFYFLLSKLAYIKIPLNAGDFSLIDKRVIKELLAIDEYDYYVRCLRAFVGFKQTGIEYVRDARLHGTAGDSLWVNLYWAKTIIVNFSFKPLEFISQIAFLVMFFSFLFIVIDILLTIIFGNHAPRGVPTIVILILFLGGIQLLSLSIIAEYLAKIFLEVKRRPKYIIRQILNK